MKLNKHIASLLRNFANIYSDRSTEDKRINDLLSGEVTKIMTTLASMPLLDGWPELYKQHIQNLLHQKTKRWNI